MIRMEWIEFVVQHPVREVIQKDGRIRRWAAIEQMENRYLRVILLPDGDTVHNAFFAVHSHHENPIFPRY